MVWKNARKREDTELEERFSMVIFKVLGKKEIIKKNKTDIYRKRILEKSLFKLTRGKAKKLFLLY